MADNFTLSPEDRLLWQQRAPRASFWFRVSDTHPNINGGQPIPGLGVAPPPPPYSPPRMPAPPTPTIQPYFGNSQPNPALGVTPPLPYYAPPHPPTHPLCPHFATLPQQHPTNPWYPWHGSPRAYDPILACRPGTRLRRSSSKRHNASYPRGCSTFSSPT